MFRSFKALMIAAPVAMLVGCNSAQKAHDQAMTTPSAETKTAANQEGAGEVIEINFAQGSSELTEGNRQALRDMIGKAKTRGEVDEIKVLAWSDKDYPADKNQELPAGDRDLASRRANAIQEFVKAELAVDDVDTYNMAARPNVFQEVFNTSDAEMKRMFQDAGVTSADGKSVSGKASRAVVMATLED